MDSAVRERESAAIPDWHPAGPLNARVLSVTFGYGVAMMAVASAWGLRWLVNGMRGDGSAFEIYYTAVAIVAVVAGGGPAILATALGVAVEWLSGTHGSDGNIAIGLFGASGVLIGSIAEGLRQWRWHTLSVQEREARDRIAEMKQAAVDLWKAAEDHHRAEEALRQEQELAQAIVNTAPMIVLVLDPQGRVLRFNPFMEWLTGWSQAEARGRVWFDTFLPESAREEIRTRFSRSITGQRTHAQINSIVTRNGEKRDIEWYDAPLRDASGTLVGLLATGQDITDRRRAEESLRQREAQLSAILTTAADAIITINRQGEIQTVNPAAELLFGYPAAEMVGRKVRMLMLPWFRGEFSNDLGRSACNDAAGGITFGREATGRHRDGTLFPIEVAMSEIDHLHQFTAIIRDATRRKKLEREVVESASREQRRIGQDLHDTVGQELTALSMVAGDLMEVLNTDPDAARTLAERLSRCLQRCQAQVRVVIRGLLPVPVDAEGLMAALADLADRTRLDSKINCTFDCPERVNVADNLTATHLYLIAQEAVHNAVKHARAQTIQIGLMDRNGLVLRVRDNGVGLTAPKEEERGLGLRIMRNRAAIIGTRLTVEPAFPSGTVVTCEMTRETDE